MGHSTSDFASAGLGRKQGPAGLGRKRKRRRTRGGIQRRCSTFNCTFDNARSQSQLARANGNSGSIGSGAGGEGKAMTLPSGVMSNPARR